MDPTEAPAEGGVRSLAQPYFQAVIENAWDMFAVLDRDTTILYLSPSTERVFGYPIAEMMGRLGLEFIHPEEREFVTATMKHAVEHPEHAVTFDHRFLHRDGSWRFVRSAVKSLRDLPRVGGLVVHSQDVTEQSSLRAELDGMRLRMQRMQLHPHFLFNTLAAIQELIIESPASAERMLISLATLLRLSFRYADAGEVTLGQELEFLRSYLQIQQVRYADRLEAVFDVEPEAEHALVPDLLLQPLVENSLRHGLATRGGSGRVHIRAERRGESLSLRVQDDGTGLAIGEELVRDGVGLTSTRVRLRQAYGSSATLVVTGAPGGGTLVSIEVPFRAGPIHPGDPPPG